MTKPTEKASSVQKAPRPPIVAILGHVDHGKSSLLDYIRKSNVAEGAAFGEPRSITEREAGGITQHLGAYEVTHTGKDGKEHAITFLDTPGHEAFKGIRERGASVADVAILVVSAEEGVKPQTLEALSFIKQTKTPYVVALTKIDKPTADIERAKQNLAEKEIYLEGYGGDIPFAAVSAKTGAGIDELLDLVLLVTELHEVTGSAEAPLEAFVIEANRDKRKGMLATVIIKNGVIRRGDYIVAGDAYTQTRQLEDFRGIEVELGLPGMPVRIVGWSAMPSVGVACRTAETKREAEAFALEARFARARRPNVTATTQLSERAVLPLVVKADTAGSLEAIESELRRLATDKVEPKVIARGIGPINESDVKMAQGAESPVIVGFNVSVDAPAKGIIERRGITTQTFDVIYKLGEWVAELVQTRTPKVTVTTVKANARVLKVFTTERDRQVIGGKVLEGIVEVGDEFRLLRRDAEIGRGKIKELQRFKEKIAAAAKDTEFGAFVQTTIAAAPGDRIEAITTIEK